MSADNLEKQARRCLTFTSGSSSSNSSRLFLQKTRMKIWLHTFCYHDTNETDNERERRISSPSLSISCSLSLSLSLSVLSLSSLSDSHTHTHIQQKFRALTFFVSFWSQPHHRVVLETLPLQPLPTKTILFFAFLCSLLVPQSSFSSVSHQHYVLFFTSRSKMSSSLPSCISLPSFTKWPPKGNKSLMNHFTTAFCHLSSLCF